MPPQPLRRPVRSSNANTFKISRNAPDMVPPIFSAPPPPDNYCAVHYSRIRYKIKPL